MSGPICPDCKMFDIQIFTDDKRKTKNKCAFCNWQGAPLPRKILALPQLRAYGKEQREMKEQRKKGKLFFIRIYADKTNKIMKDDYVSIWLMNLLKINHLDYPDHELPYFFIKATKKPTEETIKKIKSLKGVVDIKIF